MMNLLNAATVRTMLSNDEAFRISLKFLTGSVGLKIDDAKYMLTVRDGEFLDFAATEDVDGAEVVFSGDARSWQDVLSANRPPGCQGILYNDGRSGVSYAADPVALGVFSRAILEMERVLRNACSGVQRSDLLPEVERDFEVIVGRYVYLRVQGVQYRVYYEEAGSGSVPMLFQHTAGADGRQARHFLEDSDLQKRFRMISYDLPFHGNSLPPASHRWWEEEFRLTKEFLFDFLLSLSAKLELDRPVFMGSAIGGLLALHLAYELPDDFRAVIALNSGPKPEFEKEQREMLRMYSDPRIGSQWTSTLMVANMASTTPEVYRRELGWIYSQAGQDATEGALHYYAEGYDLTPDQLSSIDTSKVRVYLFTGEDDFMATERGTDRIASLIPGARYQRLRRLGHFGCAENPDALKQDLWTAFEELSVDS
ncbi:alpha/beta hydrolase [Nocardioides immobilis]|uniref:Alpha/beta hydrolase n=2 Tax=Nocardioides immobilis TaxID=2049295 RepID=A0A417XTV5_9ACTN|nr:alpha/beta hydrolase [Nocardioides immobilis]